MFQLGVSFYEQHPRDNMGYLDYCYVDSKSFEFRFEVSGGVRLAERSGHLFRGVTLGWSSLVWLIQVVERLSKGEEDNDKWRTFRLGSTVYVVLRRKNKYGQFIELSEYVGGGRRSYVVISEGSDGKGWVDVWVQLQKLTAYHAKQQAGGIVAWRKYDAAPKTTGLRREGQSYAAVLGGKTTSDVGVPVEGKGKMDTRTEPEKEVPLITAGDQAEDGGVSNSNWSAVSIMGNVMQHNLEEAKNMEELSLSFVISRQKLKGGWAFWSWDVSIKILSQVGYMMGGMEVRPTLIA
jgi:hypothetical protein